jgi:hypothetical protein
LRARHAAELAAAQAGALQQQQENQQVLKDTISQWQQKLETELQALHKAKADELEGLIAAHARAAAEWHAHHKEQV